MDLNPNKPKRPRGKPKGRTSRETLRDKIKCRDMWSTGAPMWEVYAALSHLSPHTIDDYVTEFITEYRKIYEQERPTHAAQVIANLDRVMAKVDKKKDYRTWAQLNKQKIDVLGVAQPTRHEVKAAIAVAQVPQFDLTGAPPDVLEAYEKLCGYLATKDQPKALLEAPIASESLPTSPDIQEAILTPVLQLVETEPEEDE